MQVIELSEAGLITPTILNDAIKQVARANNVIISQDTQNSFVAQVFATADFEQRGMIPRDILGHAMSTQNVEVFQMFKEKALISNLNAASEKIIHELNSFDKGLLSADDLK